MNFLLSEETTNIIWSNKYRYSIIFCTEDRTGRW